jgi:hypothetical protein
METCDIPKNKPNNQEHCDYPGKIAKYIAGKMQISRGIGGVNQYQAIIPWNRPHFFRRMFISKPLDLLSDGEFGFDWSAWWYHWHSC